ncbi:MAG: DNA polymerase III subunit beta [Thermoguttaceae bacterium]
MAMKISCVRDKFSHAFNIVASVAATRDVKPVMQNVKIEVSKKKVLLQATDGEIGVRLVVDDCEILEKGEAILPTKLIRNILQTSSESTLTIESQEDKTLVYGAKSRFTLTTQPPDEFPDIEDFSETSYHELSAKVLREMIRRTVFAIETDGNAKYALGGVLFEMIEEKATAVSTDGKRLAIQEASGSCIAEHRTENAIIPAKSLQIIERALPDDDSVVKIAISANRAIFQFGQIVFFSRLIDGRFPNWKRIIPDLSESTSLDVIGGALAANVRQAAVVTSDKQPGVVFTFDNGKLELKAIGSEIGDSIVEMPIAYSGEKRELKLDPKFVLDFLRVFPAEQNVSIHFTSNEPVSFKTDDQFIYVVMPMSNT